MLKPFNNVFFSIKMKILINNEMIGICSELKVSNLKALSHHSI